MRTGLATAAALGCLLVSAQGQQPPPANVPTGTAIVTGRVINADGGAPIAGATVSLAVSGQATGRGTSSRVLTDAEGRFFFRDLGAGSFSLTATKGGWAPGALGRRRPGGTTTPLEIKDGDRRPDLTIPMWRLAVVAGRVVDETGDPLVGIDVRIHQQTFPAGSRQFVFVAKALTDDRGAYRFSNLMPGDYLVAVPATVTSEPPGVTGAGSGGNPQTFLQTMTTIGAMPRSFDRPQVPAAGGRALVSSLVGVAVAPGAEGAWPAFATTYYPSATGISGASVVRAVSGRERADADITVRLVSTVQVSGTLALPDGSPAVQHALHLVPADLADNAIVNTATAVTDSSGNFTFYGVPPGEYVARVVRVPVPPGFQLAVAGGTGADRSILMTGGGPGSGPPPIPTEPLLWADQAVTVAGQHVRGVTMMMKPGVRMTGRLDFQGSAPRPVAGQWTGLQVNLEPASGAVLPSAVLNGRAAEDGSFQTPSMWPGRYLVRILGGPSGWVFKGAMYQGRDISESAIDLRADVEGVVLTYTDAPSKVEGTVQGSDGQPDAGALVILFPTDPSGWKDYGRTSRRVRSTGSPAGKFSMTAMPDGEYFIVAVPDEQTLNWQNPEFLQKVSALADRVSLSGQSMTLSLRTRRIQ